MSSIRLSRDYAMPWCNFALLVVQKADVGRRRLYSIRVDLVPGRSASSVFPNARLAAVGLTRVVERRSVEFSSHGPVRSGPDWESLLEFFLAAVREIREVNDFIDLTIANLFNAVDNSPPRALRGGLSLLPVRDRNFLSSARTRLATKTERFLAQAVSVFTTGVFLSGPALSIASQVSDADTEE